MERCCSLVAWNRPIPPVTNATSWTTLDNFIILYPRLHTGKHTPGVPATSPNPPLESQELLSSWPTAALKGTTEIRRSIASAIADDLQPCWHHVGGIGVHDPKICPRHNACELAEFKLEHIQKMLRWHRVTQLYRYQWSRYGTEGDFSINPRPHPCCA